MTFTWHSNLELARHLAEMERGHMRDDPEAYYRASVGRSYYTCHKLVRDWLDKEGFLPSKKKGVGIHIDVIDNLKIYMEGAPAKRIGWYLRDLRHHRTEADYELVPNDAWSKDRALDCVERAESLIEVLTTSAKPINK